MLQFIKSTIAFIGAIFFSAVNKLFCSPCVQKYVAYFWLGFFTVSDAMASSKGAGGFTKATTEIQSYETPVANLMKAIAAVIVLVGAFNVYFKMQNGDQDVKKTVMMTIGGCVAFIAMSEALPMFFK
jgi:hypothetical protein